MGQPQIIEKNLTIEEWVELEQSGEVRYEYHFGEVSLKQYMIASQAGPYVTVYNKNEATGKFNIDPFEVRGLEGVIELFSVHLQLPMTALYRNVEFDKTSTHLHPVKK